MADFEPAVELVLRHEGGYVDDPDDPGGATKYGISAREFPKIDICALTVEEAKKIYDVHYWMPSGLADVEDQGVANFIFDLLVNMGSYRDGQIVQRACNSLGDNLVVDGRIGPITIEAINGCDPAELKNAIANEARRFYEELDQPRFLQGWLNRVESDLRQA